MSDAVHLGDGAYVLSDGWYLWLEAERPCPFCARDVTNRVALEPSAVVALVRYTVAQNPDMAGPLAEAAGGAR